MDKVDLIYGTGPLGRAVMKELLTRGKQVRMVNTTGIADVPHGVTIVKCNAYSAEETRACSIGADVVYLCAQPAYTQWVEKFPALMKSISVGAASNVSKLVMGDNLYMYGEVHGNLHEGLPHAAHTRKGRVRAQIAQDLFDLHKRGVLQATIGRGSDFFGPHVFSSSLGDRVFPQILRDRSASGIGNLDLLHTYTFVEDFGKALVMLGESEKAYGEVWHVPNPQTMTTRQVIHLAFKLAGKPPKVASIGKMMIRIGGLFVPMVKEALEMMYQFDKPFVVDHSKFTHAFGDIANSMEEALAKTLNWYKMVP
jgi:nucleoside-diphosphate-sugar epimerase